MKLPDTGRPLRAWQQAALETYVEKNEPTDFLVTATPGAGKTTFALTFARWMLERRLVARVIVVVPTDHLRTQWAEAANEIGVSLDPSLSNDVAMFSEDYQGYVSTYAQVALKPLLHRRRTETRPTLVILDEIHHAGDGLTWGQGVRDAFNPAQRRLSLTGTPFRTSASEKIPFVTYETESDGSQRSVADYTYGYAHALADHVVRPVMFAAYSGVARWRNSAGEVVAATLGEDNSKSVQMTAWKTALNPAGQWIPHVIAAADQRLTEVREAGMRDAGAMMLASDQEHARAYAAVIERVTGRKPVVVLSEDPKASLKIDGFAKSDERWLVAVRMVSEGVDVPRLAVGVWATAYRTPLFFAQAVGRFVRSRARGETATVFLPAVRSLLALAAEMETEREHVIAPPKEPDDLLDPFQPELPEPSDEVNGYEALDAEAEFAHVLFGGRAVTGDEQVPSGPPVAMSEEEEEFLGLPGLLDPTQMATLLKSREVQLRRTVQDRGVSDQTPSQVQQTHKQQAALRKELNSLVNRIAMRTGRPHARVHADARAQVKGPASASASLEVLQARRDYLLEVSMR